MHVQGDPAGVRLQAPPTGCGSRPRPPGAGDAVQPRPPQHSADHRQLPHPPALYTGLPEVRRREGGGWMEGGRERGRRIE